MSKIFTCPDCGCEITITPEFAVKTSLASVFGLLSSKNKYVLPIRCPNCPTTVIVNVTINDNLEIEKIEENL